MTAAATGYRSLLGNGELVALLVVRGISGLGDQVARVVLALVVLQRADGGPLLSALVLAVAYLPLTIGFAVLGSMADRFPRKQVLIACDAARAALIGVLAVLISRDVSITAILLVLLAAELFVPPAAAASQALLPDVARNVVEYQRANALQSTLDQFVQVAGFVLGGVLLQLASANWALGFDAATFIVAGAIVSLAVRTRPAPDEPGTSARRIVSDVKSGVLTVARNRGLRWIALLAWVSAALLVATDGVALPYGVSHGVDDTGSTLLLAATPAGAAIAAFLVGRRSITTQLRIAFPLATLSTVPMIVTGFDPHVVLAGMLWFAVGLCQGYIVTVMTLTVVLTPVEQRGRVTGLVGAGFNACAALGLLLVGALTAAVTAAFALTFVGAIGMAIIVLVWMLWPTRDVREAVRTTYGAIPSDQ